MKSVSTAPMIVTMTLMIVPAAAVNIMRDSRTATQAPTPPPMRSMAGPRSFPLMYCPAMNPTTAPMMTTTR